MRNKITLISKRGIQCSIRIHPRIGLPAVLGQTAHKKLPVKHRDTGHGGIHTAFRRIPEHIQRSHRTSIAEGRVYNAGFAHLDEIGSIRILDLRHHRAIQALHSKESEIPIHAWCHK